MTSASYSRPRPVADIETATTILRAEGHRVSATRRLVLEGLLEAEGPVSAELLAAGMAGSDLASVYRNLELLEQLGLVRHVHIGHGPGLYALVSEDERCYVVCEHCAEIRRVPADEVETIRERIRAATGFEAHFTHFPILGLCAACAARRDRGEEPPAPRSHDHPHPPGLADGGHEHEHSHGDRLHSHPHSHAGDG